jgi:hypothetical protein
MTDGDIRFQARVATFEPAVAPSLLVEHGHKLEAEAGRALEAGQQLDAERRYRQAIERFVDAFLLDRNGQRQSFTEAHRLGRLVQEHFACPLKSDDGEWWSSGCGVLALHQRVGASFGGVTKGRCSICGAEDLGCLHVPGYRYGDEQCIRIVYEADVVEVSLVQFPEDPRCYRVEFLYSLAQLEKANPGHPSAKKARPVCNHCAGCSGADDGPTDEDVDQSSWAKGRARPPQ